MIQELLGLSCACWLHVVVPLERGRVPGLCEWNVPAASPHGVGHRLHDSNTEIDAIFAMSSTRAPLQALEAQNVSNHQDASPVAVKEVKKVKKRRKSLAAPVRAP